MSPGQSEAERRGSTAASPRGMLDRQHEMACSLGLGDHRLCHSEVSPLKGSTCSRATFLLRTRKLAASEQSWDGAPPHSEHFLVARAGQSISLPSCEGLPGHGLLYSSGFPLPHPKDGTLTG